MKIFLQNASTLHFYCADGTWEAISTRAECFASAVAALRCSLERKLPNVQVLYAFPTSSHNFAIPVKGDSPAANPRMQAALAC